MRAFMTTSLLLASGGAAFAGGGLSCRIDDDNMKLSAGAALSRGMGGSFQRFDAEMTVRSASLRSVFPQLTFNAEDLTQKWLDGRDLKLRLYPERESEEPHGYVEIEIHAVVKPDDEGSYSGHYEMTVFDALKPDEERPLRATGAVRCSVE